MFRRIREFIRFWKYNTHPAKMEVRARSAVLFGANKALKMFQDKAFRAAMHFEKKNEEEHNRIFNELTVTNLIFLKLLLDQLVLEEEDEDKKNYTRALNKEVLKYFKDFLRRINIPKKYALIWNKLIDLRYNEYKKEMLEVRGEFLRHSDEKLHEYALDNRVMIFQTVALGLYRHLVRGKIKKGDPLFNYLQPYLLNVHKGYLKKI